MTARFSALIRAITLGGALAAVVATPGVTAAQEVFPGSSGTGSISSDEKEVEVRQDSPKGQSQVVSKQRISYTLEVHWQVVDDGLSDREPFTLKPVQDNVCANTNYASHADCDAHCGIHAGVVSGSAKGDWRDLVDNMNRAHRDSKAQNKEVGSDEVNFDSASTDIRRRVKRWAEESVRVSGGSSRAQCAFTSHSWQWRRYTLQISWTWKRATRTLSAATGGRWSGPVIDTVNVTTPTTADIMEVHRLDPTTHTTHDVVVCLCGGKKTPEPPKTPPPPPPPTGVTYPTPTHRQTNCAACKGLADQLNAASDKFNQAVAAGASGTELGSLFATVTRLGQELNECEKKCSPPRTASNVRMINVMPGMQTGAVNAAFQNMIVEAVPGMVADASPRPPSVATTLASVRQFVVGWFTSPSALTSADRTTTFGSFRQAHPGDIVALNATTTAGGAGEVSVSLIATGSSTGQVFRLQALNTTGSPVSLGAPDGLVLQPLKQAAQAMTEKLQRQAASQSVNGYCLDFAKLPPSAGTLYRVGDDTLQQQFAPMTRVLQAGRALAASGKLHPDSDPTAYADATKQWAVWSRLEKWNAGDFERHFVERTHKNVEAAKQTWNSDVEQRVRQLVPNRWRDITAVWAEADTTAGEPRR